MLICDIEGAERGLLGSNHALRLLKADMLLELYESASPRSTEELSKKFAKIKIIELIDRGKGASVFPPGMDELSYLESLLTL